MPAQFQTLEKDQLGGRGIARWAWLELHQLADIPCSKNGGGYQMDSPLAWAKTETNSTGWAGIYGKTFTQITEYLPR